MSQQHPQQPGWGAPQQPGYGASNQPQHPGYGTPPPGWGAPQPQPPKKSPLGKILGFGCLGIVALFVLLAAVGAALGGDTSDDTSSKDKAVTTDAAPKAEDSASQEAAKEQPAEEKSQAEQFKDCVTKSGTATEKAAIKHVTKVTGADKNNDILDTAEVFTDYSGGLLGEDASNGKLIASAFASCYESDNGLVTVYDKDGEILSNGNY